MMNDESGTNGDAFHSAFIIPQASIPRHAGAPGTAALRPLWPRKVRVGENSPSLCPTMSSVTNTRRCLLPLCTSNVCPTNSGMIVHARAHVRMGCFARFSLSFDTFLYNFSSTYGPFFALLLMLIPLPAAYCHLPVRYSPSAAAAGTARTSDDAGSASR